jgi:hypothetical protein
MECWGVGDVAGVPSREGFSEKVIEDGLEGGDEDGKELRVPLGEPLGVNTAGQSMAALVLWVKQPLLFHS